MTLHDDDVTTFPVVVPEPGLLRRNSASGVARRVFPDAYRDRAESADFRARHRERLRDTGPAMRAAESCLTGSPFVLDADGVDDWISTMGFLSKLRSPLDGALTSVNGSWYTHIQPRLVPAADPALA